MTKPGIWCTNGMPTDAVKMLSWKPGAVTVFFDYLHSNRIVQYKRANPDCKVIIRFQHPRNWREDIAVSAHNHANELLAKWLDIRGVADYVYFANELNLGYESGDADPAHQWQFETREFYQAVADWTRRVANQVKQAQPDYPLVMWPMAAGHHEDGAPDDNGNPTEGWAGYDYLSDLITSHFGGTICGHYYWGDASGSIAARLYDPVESSWHAFRWHRVRKLFETRYGTAAKIIIDEAGNFGAADADFTEQCCYYARETLMDPCILALTFFLWQDPTRSPGNISNSWWDRCLDLDGHIAALGALDVPRARTIRVYVDGRVETLLLETYLRGVVPAEMPPAWDMDALKAQAVWARSYALWRIANPRHASFDLYATASDQVWNPKLIHERSDQAVRETAGMALLQGGKPFAARYVARCGRVDCPSCQGSGGTNGETWNGRACQYGAQEYATRGKTWQQIAVAYYDSQEVMLSDIDTPAEEPPDGGGNNPPGGNEPMWDIRLNAYSEANGKVTGVKCIVEPHDTIRTHFGNPVLPQGGWYWKCVSGAFLNEDEALGRFDITVSMVDENGAPYPGAAWFAYPSERMGQPSWNTAFDNGGGPGQVFAYPTGQGSIAMGANDFSPKTGVIGPYIVGISSPAEPNGVISSELVYGMGMPYNRHVAFSFVFQRKKLGTTPPPGPGPEPEPEPGGGLSAALLADAFRAIADGYNDAANILDAA